MRQRRGFALMAAMWLVVLLGIGGWQLSISSRARRLAAANAIELGAARAGADAALETGFAMLADTLASAQANQSRLNAEGATDPWLAFSERVPDSLRLGDERATLQFYDPASRLNLNHASADDLRRFLSALPMDASDADQLAQRVVDWRDADDQPRARGAERADYLRSGARRLPSNADFGSIDELLSVEGMTASLLSRIAPHLTLLGVGQINVNVAPSAVLYSLPGFGDEAVAAVLRLRQQRQVIHSREELARDLSRSAAEALAAASPELDARLAFDTREMVVESVGWLDGSPVRVHAELLATRSGESVLVQTRRSQLP